MTGMVVLEPYVPDVTAVLARVRLPDASIVASPDMVLNAGTPEALPNNIWPAVGAEVVTTLFWPFPMINELDRRLVVPMPPYVTPIAEPFHEPEVITPFDETAN